VIDEVEENQSDWNKKNWKNSQSIGKISRTKIDTLSWNIIVGKNRKLTDFTWNWYFGRIEKY
jgi:hypothetical protein